MIRTDAKIEDGQRQTIVRLLNAQENPSIQHSDRGSPELEKSLASCRADRDGLAADKDRLAHQTAQLILSNARELGAARELTSEATVLYESAPPALLLRDPRLQAVQAIFTIAGHPLPFGALGGKVPRWFIPARVVPTVYGDPSGTQLLYVDAQGNKQGPFAPQVLTHSPHAPPALREDRLMTLGVDFQPYVLLFVGDLLESADVIRGPLLQPLVARHYDSPRPHVTAKADGVVVVLPLRQSRLVNAKELREFLLVEIDVLPKESQLLAFEAVWLAQ